MTLNLTGHFLIAMPSLKDPRFDHTVVFICAHDNKGVMGLIINKPLESHTMADLIEQSGMDVSAQDFKNIPLYFGGPVDMGRGFILHSDDFLLPSSVPMQDGLAMTMSLEILHQIVQGKGPKDYVFMVGYSGWNHEKLSDEMKNNAWLQCEGVPDLIFKGDPSLRWLRVMHHMGINPDLLSYDAGHA